ncbi:hypothetical protein DAEQUDRAFT_313677 [Daedalea quercina L-15889]|uniref:Uncharacterized protein n=1 Tax=Daedalea quercina L-15889 TaxID=1314783 RepID=A0A165PV02_9APHY|nr:hypothetical protein DAEQUDRAFT_313677 [Daedalea quercina L-15889]
MAEAVFDDHPLEEYFRLAGEVQPIPGGAPEFSQEPDDGVGEAQESLLALERLPSSLVNLIQTSSALGSGADMQSVAACRIYQHLPQSLWSHILDAMKRMTDGAALDTLKSR